MKNPQLDERTEEAAPTEKKRQTTVEMRLVSRPDQSVLREWEITLPDDLVDRLVFKFRPRRAS